MQKGPQFPADFLRDYNVRNRSTSSYNAGSLGDRVFTADEADEYHDDRGYEEEMDEPSDGIGRHQT